MPTNVDQTTKRLLKHYSITTKRDNGVRKLYPAKIDYETGDIRPVNLDTDVQRYFKNWVNDLVGNDELRNRFERYKSLDFMDANGGYINLALKLYSNETITPDESGKIINVFSKDKKVEAYINDFFNRIGIDRSLLENLSYEIAKYADSFWIRSIEPQLGITEVTPVSPYQVSKRIEFSAIDQMKKETKNYQSYAANAINQQDLVDLLTAKLKSNDYADTYKRYLFGFALEENKVLLPPWAMSHFRRFSTQSEFSPYGRPLLINSLSIFREYKSSQNLQAMARVANFPKEVFQVVTDPNMTPTEKMLAVNEIRQEYQNFISITNGKEDYGIFGSIWTIKDSFEYELLSPNIDLGNVADIELLQNELIASTLIPKAYLISEGWGDSGKALLQQSKIFAREVYTNQTAILSELTDLVKTQFVLLDLFDKEDTEFELQLSYPIKEQSKDNLEIQKDSMDFANAIISNLQTALAIDSIPTSVAKDILNKYAGFDKKDLDAWMKDIEGSVDLEINKFDQDLGKPKYTEKLQKALGRLSEDVVRESYFNAKKKMGLNEGTFNNVHYYSSWKDNKSTKLKYEMTRKLCPFYNGKTNKIEG